VGQITAHWTEPPKFNNPNQETQFYQCSEIPCWQQIFKSSLQVTVVGVLPHMTVEHRHVWHAARQWLLITVSFVVLHCAVWKESWMIKKYCCANEARFSRFLPWQGVFSLWYRKGKILCERAFALHRQQHGKDKQNVEFAPPPGKISADAHAHTSSHFANKWPRTLHSWNGLLALAGVLQQKRCEQPP